MKEESQKKSKFEDAQDAENDSSSKKSMGHLKMYSWNQLNRKQ